MNKREGLLASSMICGVALLMGAPAMAADEEVAEVVVTGSRIPQPNLEGVSPVQVVDSQEVLLGGRPVTADFISQLPQISNNPGTALGSMSNPLSGPGGVATIDLRGLGQQRTLVLIDGRRLGIGDPNTGNTNPSPDINQIPSQLIERVEVLTGGASATYGSDAVAGVVNFKMKRDFEGVQIDAQWGAYQHNQHNEFVQGLVRANPSPIEIPKDAFDGKSRDLSILIGANAPDDRGNLTAFFTYHDQDPVNQAKRDYSACQVNHNGVRAFCSGSSNSNIFYRADGEGDAFSVLGNQFVVRSTSNNTNPPYAFNSNDYAYLIQQSTRYTAGYFANYQLNDRVELYSDFNFMNDRSRVQIAPTGLFQGSSPSDSGGFLVNCNNPFLSAQQRGAIGCTAANIAAGDSVDLYIGRRNVEGGGRLQFYEHVNYRVVGGARGDLGGSWKYDAYGSYYYTSLYAAAQNYLSLSRIQNALQVVQGANGPVCVSGGACVPYNIFQDGGVTQAALDYLDIEGTSRGAVSQRIFETVITGDLGDYGIKSPWAEDSVGVAFGFQSRRDHLEYSPDAAQLSGDLSGSGGASTPIDNSLSVIEGYGEIRLPLISDAPFARNVTLEGGYRYSDYSTGIKADTYRAGVTWAFNDDVALRASYQRALRAPSILELYTPQATTNTSQVSVDPCAQGVPAAQRATLEQCVRTGVTPAQYGNIPQCPSNQCGVLSGGNPGLAPEVAKTFSVGLTFTPRAVRGFNATVDYFDIKVEDIIGAVSLGVILQNCLQTGEEFFCSQINRAPNGVLFGAGYINGTNVNVGELRTKGVDLQANYRLPLDSWGLDNWGRVSVNLTGSYLQELSTVSLPGNPAYDCAGLYGPQCGTVNPRWRHTLRVTWTTPWDVTASVAWRHMGEVKLETDTNEPTVGNGSHDPFNHLLPSRSYMDVSAIWKVREQLTLRAGVNNVFDQDPPLVNAAIAGSGLPNTYPNYDLLGRRLFVGLTAQF